MKQNPEHYAVQAMDDDMISLSEIACILLRGKRWIIGATLTFFAGALCYLFLVDPVYRSSAMVKIDRSQSALIFDLLDIEDVTDVSVSSVMAIEQIRSPDFVRNVFSVTQPQSDYPLTDAIKAFQERLQVSEKSKGSGVLEIAVTGTDPEENIRVLNAIIEQYFDQRGVVLVGSIGRSLALLNARLIKLDEDIRLFPTQNSPAAQSDRLIELKLAQRNTQNKIEVLESAKKIALNDRSVLSAPLSDKDPIRPKYTLVMVLAIMLGGVLGVVLVFIREMMRQGLRTSIEVENKTGLTVFAEVASSGGSKNTVRDREGFKVLRTNLLYRLSKATNNRVMICSSMPEAQQDDVITQLASELSEAGKKVLLLDADLRQGALFKHFDKTGEQGLADNLMNSDHSVVAINQYLDLVSGSSRPSNPSELLMCLAFNELVEWASSQYEVILINVPPVLKATDAAIVGDLCDTSLVVIQAEATSIKDIEAANRRLQQAGVLVNGAVFIRTS